MNESKRRFPIPSPGSLLVVGLLLTAIGVWLTIWVPYHRQQVAIREIEQLSMLVFSEQGGPSWLRKLVGDERMKGFDSVVQVTVSPPFFSQLSDVDLVHFKRFTHIEDLSLRNMQVTDDGLKHLSGLTSLRTLRLGGTQVTDAGLTHLSSLIKLKHLSLGDTTLTDVGLDYLSGLTGLRHLHLPHTRITHAGVESFKHKRPDCSITWY